MASELDGFLYLLAPAAIAVWFGAQTNWSFESDRRFQVVACEGLIDKDHRCDSRGWERENEISVRIERPTNSILIFDQKTKAEDASRLNDCLIVDDDNWTCGPIGVSNGRYYDSRWTLNVPTNASSLQGWPYFLHRLGIYSLDRAMQEDGFPPRSPAVTPQHASTDSSPMTDADLFGTEHTGKAKGDVRAAPPGFVAANSSDSVASDGDRPATVAEILAHGGRWIGSKLFYGTCPPGAWVGGEDRLPPLKYLCPPRTTDVPANNNSTDASDVSSPSYSHWA